MDPKLIQLLREVLPKRKIAYLIALDDGLLPYHEVCGHSDCYALIRPGDLSEVCFACRRDDLCVHHMRYLVPVDRSDDGCQTNDSYSICENCYSTLQIIPDLVLERRNSHYRFRVITRETVEIVLKRHEMYSRLPKGVQNKIWGYVQGMAPDLLLPYIHEGVWKKLPELLRHYTLEYTDKNLSFLQNRETVVSLVAQKLGVSKCIVMRAVMDGGYDIHDAIWGKPSTKRRPGMKLFARNRRLFRVSDVLTQWNQLSPEERTVWAMKGIGITKDRESSSEESYDEDSE